MQGTKITSKIQEIDTMSNTKPVRLARKVLTEISGDNQSLESLNFLLEVLENKLDPCREEIHLLSAIYQVVEKVKLLEAYLVEFTKEHKEGGDRLQDLYDKLTKHGTSKLFNY